MTRREKPLIHIGYHKTGTTWLQRVYFPRLRNVRQVPRADISAALLRDSALKFDPDDARRVLDPEPGVRPLISMEALSGYLHNAGYNGCLSKDMVARLRATFGDAHILIFLRRQPEVIAACYAQYVRCGGTAPVARYVWPGEHIRRGHYRPDKVALFNVDHFDYLPLLRLYRDTFGPENVHVYLYEAFKADREAFLQRFSEALGLEVGPPRGRDRHRNRSYPPWLLQVGRQLNRLTALNVVDKRYLVHVPGWYHLNRVLMEAVTRAGPVGSGTSARGVLGERNLRRLRQYYSQSNRQLQKEFALPLERYGYPGC